MSKIFGAAAQMTLLLGGKSIDKFSDFVNLASRISIKPQGTLMANLAVKVTLKGTLKEKYRALRKAIGDMLYEQAYRSRKMTDLDVMRSVRRIENQLRIDLSFKK